MIQIILAIIILLFGFFLKKTNHPGFRSSKRFAIMFIILGGAVLLGKLVSYFLHPA
jgi:undecaprenyl pyrophosphate phosphatase UppP